jgi:hypothetical protein
MVGKPVQALRCMKKIKYQAGERIAIGNPLSYPCGAIGQENQAMIQLSVSCYYLLKLVAKISAASKVADVLGVC